MTINWRAVKFFWRRCVREVRWAAVRAAWRQRQRSSWRCRLTSLSTVTRCHRVPTTPVASCSPRLLSTAHTDRHTSPLFNVSHGFTKAADRRRINLLLERANRYDYCMPDLLTFEELCDTADDQLFNKTVSNSSQVLHTALPPPSTGSQHYNLRRRTHTRSLPEHFTYLSDRNFITWMLYKHSY